MRFLHCSDVHITQDYAATPLRALGWRRTLALFELKFGGRSNSFAVAGKTLRRIAEASLAEDHLILSGDLTAYAMDAEFAGAQQALAAVVHRKQRCTIIPGNHDRYTPRALSQHRFEKYFGALLESDLPEYVAEDGFPFVRLLGDRDAVIGLCSARVPALPGFSFGFIGRAQLGALARLVQDPRLAGRAVLVAVHHAPFKADGTPDKPLHGLRDAAELLALLPGPRFAVLHGHIHHRFHHPATPTRPHVFGAGSSTQKGREGFWVIETRDGAILKAEKRPVPETSSPE